ncbi:MAG: site-specific integrase [Bacteroidetes bacterium]|nr:site-specific integrase [Bacteroidota bacterium]
MSVKLRKRKNSDSTTTLYLDIYHNGKRYYEFLKHLKLILKPSSPVDRQKNKENIEIAESIRNRRAQELESSDFQIVNKFKGRVDFLEYFQTFIDNYKKKDKRVIVSTQSKFKDFLKEMNVKGLTINQVTESFVIDFKDYLLHELNGESPANYFSKFKKVLIQATRDKVININPAANITVKRVEGVKKDILTIEEIGNLAATPITNNEVKRAFIFSCFTGLRFCDVVALKWGHIDLKNKQLSMVQSKTGHKVSVGLHDTAISILGKSGEPKEAVFVLPSHTACLKDLRHWVKKAEISKKITWHCARHSFATNIIFFGADVNTASSLLGHTSLKYTQRYTHVVQALKEKAIDNLPTVSLT